MFFLKKGLGNDIKGSFITKDGIEYFFVDWSPYVDVNGAKGPNKSWRYIFHFEIASKDTNNIKQGTILPVGSKLYNEYYNTGSSRYWKDNNECTTKSPYIYCAGRVLEEDAMNY